MKRTEKSVASSRNYWETVRNYLSLYNKDSKSSEAPPLALARGGCQFLKHNNRIF
ncbi:MAG: hypothetical protein ACYCSW_10085 [bacterium]